MVAQVLIIDDGLKFSFFRQGRASKNLLLNAPIRGIMWRSLTVALRDGGIAPCNIWSCWASEAILSAANVDSICVNDTFTPPVKQGKELLFMVRFVTERCQLLGKSL
uniref:Uncharacterized protein n=1 Tax=Octopus bimaculoides TaxID=37653 RepID=A0A0L8GQE2_OCTBM